VLGGLVDAPDEFGTEFQLGVGGIFDAAADLV